MCSKQKQKGGRNGGRLLTLCFLVGLLLALGAEVFVDKHPKFAWSGVYGFFAGYGMLSGVLFLVLARILRGVVRRNEDYYDQ